MKKLLALILVLALSGVATASLDVFITDTAGNSEIGPLEFSDYVELVVWYTWDAGTLGGIDMEIGNDDHINGTLGQPTVTATGRNPIYDYVGEGFDEGMDWEFNASTDIGGGLSKGIATPLATLLFHCEGAISDCTLSGLDVYTVDNLQPVRSQVFPTYHSMIIHQVPEPATIALLCLGGLLLRKKK